MDTSNFNGLTKAIIDQPVGPENIGPESWYQILQYTYASGDAVAGLSFLFKKIGGFFENPNGLFVPRGLTQFSKQIGVNSWVRMSMVNSRVRTSMVNSGEVTQTELLLIKPKHTQQELFFALWEIGFCYTRGSSGTVTSSSIRRLSKEEVLSIFFDIYVPWQLVGISVDLRREIQRLKKAKETALLPLLSQLEHRSRKTEVNIGTPTI